MCLATLKKNNNINKYKRLCYSGDFGATDPDIFGVAIPIRAIASPGFLSLGGLVVCQCHCSPYFLISSLISGGFVVAVFSLISHVYDLFPGMMLHSN